MAEVLKHEGPYETPGKSWKSDRRLVDPSQAPCDTFEQKSATRRAMTATGITSGASAATAAAGICGSGASTGS
jgi:hypothetical protein